ncbi:MAG: hypothetical protein WB623_25105, partial [Candidatus Sulfotelmatobacter sp.]
TRWPINFPKNDLPRVPEHWRTFGARVSPHRSVPMVRKPDSAGLPTASKALEGAGEVGGCFG